MFPAQIAANSLKKSQYRVLIEDTDLKSVSLQRQETFDRRNLSGGLNHTKSVSFQEEETFDRRNLSVGVNHSNDETEIKVRSPISPKKKKKRLSAADGSLNPIKKGGYREMMQELSKQIDKQSYVKRDPDYEKRRLFYSEPRDDAAMNIMHELMHKIAFFQIEKNNLDYIKGVKEVKESAMKLQQQKEEKKNNTLQLPKKILQQSTLPI